MTQRFYKKAAAFVLRAVAKHSPHLAQVSSQTHLRISFQHLIRKAHLAIAIIDEDGKMQLNGWIFPSTVVIICTIINRVIDNDFSIIREQTQLIYSHTYDYNTRLKYICTDGIQLSDILCDIREISV